MYTIMKEIDPKEKVGQKLAEDIAEATDQDVEELLDAEVEIVSVDSKDDKPMTR